MLLLLLACDREPVLPDAPGNLTEGVFVLNEGQFMADNSSLSYYEISGGNIYHNLFYSANGNTRMGDVAQSMVISGDTAYIVINNSGKIWAIHTDTYEFIGKISGLTSPRYMQIVAPGKAYVTDLYAGKIHVIDPGSVSVSGEIDVRNPAGFPGQHSTERILLHGNRAFVACWSFDNKILVLDTGNDRITDSVEVTPQPNSMVMDRDGMLWVLSDGGFAGSPYGQEKAALTVIDPSDLSIKRVLNFNAMEDSPVDLQTNPTADSLYYLNGSVFKMAISDTRLPDEPLIRSRGRNIYSLGVDPVRGTVYLGDAVDFRQRGWVYRYQSSGVVIDSMRAGINPGFFCFKY